MECAHAPGVTCGCGCHCVKAGVDHKKGVACCKECEVCGARVPVGKWIKANEGYPVTPEVVEI